MRIFLVRHGECKTGIEDRERPLSVKGCAQARRSGTLAKRLGAAPSKIWHSTKLRARQTAEILAWVLRPRDGLECSPDLDPGARAEAWRDRLESEQRDLMLVGHLPHIAKLCALLIHGNEHADAFRFHTGYIACLERTGSGWKLAFSVKPELNGDLMAQN